MAKDWKLGTGSVLLDAASFLWAAIRQMRGKEWVVSVKPIGSKSDPVIRRFVRTREDAERCVHELVAALEIGQLTLPA